MFNSDPDLDFLPILDPGSRGQKGTGYRIVDTDPQHCLKGRSGFRRSLQPSKEFFEREISSFSPFWDHFGWPGSGSVAGIIDLVEIRIQSGSRTQEFFLFIVVLTRLGS
jgi:hypothetical protein